MVTNGLTGGVDRFKPQSIDTDVMGERTVDPSGRVSLEMMKTNGRPLVLKGVREVANPQDHLLWFDSANDCFVLERVSHTTKGLKP